VWRAFQRNKLDDTPQVWGVTRILVACCDIDSCRVGSQGLRISAWGTIGESPKYGGNPKPTSRKRPFESWLAQGAPMSRDSAILGDIWGGTPPTRNPA